MILTRIILVIALIILAKCEDECKTADRGVEYRGSIAKTISGRTCKFWSAQNIYKENQFRGESITHAGNKCRNPNIIWRPWCFTTDPKVPREICYIPWCTEVCRSTVQGKEYRGKVSITSRGFTCRPWSEMPHGNGKISLANFTDEPLAELGNYCRNPLTSARPWCFTTDSKVEWDYCDIPMCETECRKTEQGKEYRGNVAITVTGRTCQSWSLQSPHKHKLTADDFKGQDFTELENKCRNPGGRQPWCYTTDPKVEWEYCDIPLCYKECKTTVKGREYRGIISRTQGGKTCQSWSVQSPHKHTYTADNFKGQDFTEIGNKCRNPDFVKLPYCFTTDPKEEWDYCDIPMCQKECITTKQGKEYRGDLAVTSTGRICQYWSVQSPHEHGVTASYFKDEDFTKLANKCRNPDTGHEGKRPWCYTTDPNVRFEYCDIPTC